MKIENIEILKNKDIVEVVHKARKELDTILIEQAVEWQII